LVISIFSLPSSNRIEFGRLPIAFFDSTVRRFSGEIHVNPKLGFADALFHVA
jgi:hypothetical protein